MRFGQRIIASGTRPNISSGDLSFSCKKIGLATKEMGNGYKALSYATPTSIGAMLGADGLVA